MHSVLTVPLPFIGETVHVPLYLAVRVLYLLVAPWLAVRLTAPLGIRPRDTLVLFLVGIPVGVIGAHVLAVAEPGGHQSIENAAEVWSGRSAIFGGLAAAITWAAAYCAWRGIRLRRFLDGCAPVMALGEGMTRIGCFFAGCCYGNPTDSVLGVTFPPRSAVFMAQVHEGLVTYATPRSLAVHPTQLYAALFAFALGAALVWMLRRPRPFDGSVFCAFLLSYAAWRFVLAFLRADGGPPLLFGLVSSQLWSAAAATAALLLAYTWRGNDVATARRGVFRAAPDSRSAH